MRYEITGVKVNSRTKVIVIDYVAESLRKSPKYRAKLVKREGFLQNEDPAYIREDELEYANDSYDDSFGTHKMTIDFNIPQQAQFFAHLTKSCKGKTATERAFELTGRILDINASNQAKLI